MNGMPLPTIPGETAKDYKARLAAWHQARYDQDVRDCRCGCAFVIAKLQREIKRLKAKR